MSKLVKPELPGGFKDYSPAQVLARSRMFAAIERVYRRFGFVPLQTSIAQRRVVLTGGGQVENRLWNMHVDKGTISTDEETTVTARFDLTVPLARYVAENIGTLIFPFRRYETGEVFRGENTQAGRYAEFVQFDADVVGAEVGPADAEVVVCMYAVMAELGIERFLIKVNNRKVLDGFAEQLGFARGSKSAGALLRVLDKIDKIGIDGIVAELRAKTPPEGEEEAFSFDDARADKIRAFLTLTATLATNDERLNALAGYFDNGGIGAEGVAELQQIAALVKASGVPDKAWIVDSSVVRGLGYYSGPVFETYLTDLPKIGSVYSGGRYDYLLERFTGKPMPCVGASVGVDRLFNALETLGAIKTDEPDVDVFILTMDDALALDYFAIAAELRAAGVRVEINMNYQDESVKAQMSFGLSRHAPILLFYGVDDAREGKVGVKNTATRKQTFVPRAELVAAVLAILGR